MNEPLLSVIVPVYKVEPWLERCVLSIRHQTYQNLEIILVDDGSPDRCGEMCERFAQEDNRIRVIHRENGGLSAARNSGLEVCRGEYIGFVDSDDFISNQMYSLLYTDILANRTLLSFCQTLVCYGTDVVFPDPDTMSMCYPNHIIIRESLRDNKWFSACSKMYHRSLFDDIRFPEGRINEDYPVTIRIYDRCERIAVNNNKLYAYCKRGGSITTSPINERSFDQIINSEEVYLFLKETHPECSELAARNLLSSCIGMLLYTDDDHELQYETKRQEVFTLIRKYYPAEKRNPYLKQPQRLLLSAAYAKKSWFSAAAKVYKALK